MDELEALAREAYETAREDAYLELQGIDNCSGTCIPEVDGLEISVPARYADVPLAYRDGYRAGVAEYELAYRDGCP